MKPHTKNRTDISENEMYLNLDRLGSKNLSLEFEKGKYLFITNYFLV